MNRLFIIYHHSHVCYAIDLITADRQTFLAEEKVGYFQSTAKSMEEVAQENMMLEDQLAVLHGRLAILDSEIDACDWQSTSPLDVLSEPYVHVRNQLIRPFIINKVRFIEYKVTSNRRYLGHKATTIDAAPTTPDPPPAKDPPTRPSLISQSQGSNTSSDRSPGMSSNIVSSSSSSAAALFPRATPSSPVTTEQTHKHTPFRPKVMQWREEVFLFAKTSLDTMREFIPSDIVSTPSAEALRSNHRHLSLALAHRLMTKRCLWVLCLNRDEMLRVDDDSLRGVYNTKGQNLDLVETAAVYAIIPEEFFSANDSSAARVEWSDRVQKKLHHMLRERDKGTLPSYRHRCPVYPAPVSPVSASMKPKRIVPSSVESEIWGEDEDDADAAGTEPETDILQRVKSITPFGGSKTLVPFGGGESTYREDGRRPVEIDASDLRSAARVPSPNVSAAPEASANGATNKSRKRSLFSKARTLPSYNARRTNAPTQVAVVKKKAPKHAEI